MVEGKRGLEYWVARLGEAELPALAAVVQDLQQLAGEQQQSSVRQLADVLLRDASLTSQVLRVANSVYYNPSQESIRTISRAIVLIGFDNVRLIGLSVSLIDQLLGKAPREQLLELLARAFHAAVQARNLAGFVLSRQQEEVFIAALLYNVGELAFWGAGGDAADELSALLQQPGQEAEAAARQVLGVGFRQLTLGLARSWGLGEHVGQAPAASAQKDPAARAVSLGVRISEAALGGWDCDEMEALIGQVASFTQLPREEVLPLLLASAEEAVKVAATFGASRLCHLIPQTDPQQVRLQQERRRAALLQPDLALMSRCLQQLGGTPTDIEAALDSLVEGLHRGAGLERVMVAVLADKQSRYRVRRAVGEGSAPWLAGFELAVGEGSQAHLFDYVIRGRECLWMGVPASYQLNDLITPELRRHLGPGMCFVAPLLAGKRPLGVLYADSRPSGRALRREQFVSFQHFTQAVGRCLQALSQR
ncbi:HDOD domain-containing protein [Pseudomonas citronellolis]|uniref:HDOD domain-containing protein n=1 Tax=Pseudomonas citronellolis TaxID=53408 RepID=UPI0023E40BF5|nr:HDOD domain-containing protein [Pseudomonas citronellolis]MDF3931185.1 HDOD domain-containing protein [Pseudomonas citronellolis]